MDQLQLQVCLDQLIADWENEVAEFKSVGDSYSTTDIGKYFSALSNEANLRGHERAWLVFGVDNKSRKIVGSSYREDRERLHSLKHQIAQNATPSITVREIHELQTQYGRAVLFEIPPAPRGMPVAWNGHYYARAGESLVSLALDKQDEIRAQSGVADWSGQLVENATLDHLEPEALNIARVAFIQKHSNRFEENEVMEWSDKVFLDRTRLTIEGGVTRAAVLLLGRQESTHLLSPHPVQMTWKLEGPAQLHSASGLHA